MQKQKNFIKTQVRIDPELYEELKNYSKNNNLSINSSIVNFIAQGIEIEKVEADIAEIEFNKMIEEEYIDASTEDLTALVDRELSNIEKGRIAKRLLLEGLIKAADDEQMGRVFDVLVSMFNDFKK